MTSSLQPPEQKQQPRPFRPIQKYAHGFKYCMSCELWFAPGEEAYGTEDDRANQRRPRCRDCNQLLKTLPRSSAAKERLAKLTGKEVKRY